MIAKKLRNPYSLLNALRLMKIAKPLGARQALKFYTTPLKWVTNLGRARYYDLLPSSFLVLNTPYGMFAAHGRSINILFQEVYEIEHILEVYQLINKDTVFVDVGAYLGLYTIFACRHAKRVLSVEPNPMALVYLKANVALNNCFNTIIVPKVVSDKRGLAKPKILRSPMKGHVLPTSSIVWKIEKALEINVEADTLDNIVDEAGLDTIDFIKVDVEGAEGLVVKGAEKTLKKAKALLIGILPENTWVINYLQSIGYQLIKIVNHYNYHYSNYLFLNMAKAYYDV